MKKILLTLTLALTVFAGKSQQLPTCDSIMVGLTGKYVNVYQHAIIDSNAIRNLDNYPVHAKNHNTPYHVKNDTVSCWFKEVIFNNGYMDTLVTNHHDNLNNAVAEYWQHGYVVHNGTPYVYYLYANKKRVVGHVINVIDK